MTTVGTVSIPDEVFELLDRLDVRYELIDGQLVVSPSATFLHEKLSTIVRAQLVYQAPQGFDVLGPDFNVYYAHPEPDFVCPDALVAAAGTTQDDGMLSAPLLTMETVSRSSRRRDLGDKWDIYAELGVPTYWVVDPKEERLTVCELRDGVYVETATVEGDGTLEVVAPFPATIRLRKPFTHRG